MSARWCDADSQEMEYSEDNLFTAAGTRSDRLTASKTGDCPTESSLHEAAAIEIHRGVERHASGLQARGGRRDGPKKEKEGVAPS